MATSTPPTVAEDGFRADFKIASELSDFNVPARQYLACRPEIRVDGIGTGVVVFNHDRVLLLQRSLSDSMPGLWETPGGACDDEDPSILMGAARELWEEAGLQVESMLDIAGEPWLFNSRSGKRIIKFNFVAQAKIPSSGNAHEKGLSIKLSDEHEDAVWATIDEIKLGECGDMQLLFTSTDQKQILIDAFSKKL
jgi:8-oxo-dGTP pyrophosphatase MutT (NUDIX family)